MYKVKIIRGYLKGHKGTLIASHIYFKDNYVINLDKYDIKSVIYKDDFVKIEE